jgi:hypothetical protein
VVQQNNGKAAAGGVAVRDGKANALFCEPALENHRRTGPVQESQLENFPINLPTAQDYCK